jgi:hypothetical protein
MFLYLFNDGNFRKIPSSSLKLLPDRYISINGNEPVPLEDYGDYLLSPDDMTVDQAFEEWSQALELNKGVSCLYSPKKFNGAWSNRNG